MRLCTVIFALLLTQTLFGQEDDQGETSKKYVDSLLSVGVDSILVIQIGNEGAFPYNSEKGWSQFILWQVKDKHFVKKQTHSNQYKEEQVFIGHLFNYINNNSNTLYKEKFKSCVISDHYSYVTVRLRTAVDNHIFKKYGYQFSNNCPDENDYNNKLRLKRMFDIFENEINYLNKTIRWTR